MFENPARKRLVLLGCLFLPVFLSCGDLLLRGLNGQARVGSVTKGLVLHYPFDGSSDDASGNGYDGTFGSGYPGFDLTEDRFDRAGVVTHFTDPNPPPLPPAPPVPDNFGDPSYLDTGWGANLSLDSAYTINLWIRGYSPLTPMPDVEMHLFGAAFAASFPYLFLSVNTPSYEGLSWSVAGSDGTAPHSDIVAFNGPFVFLSQQTTWTMITAVHEEGFGASRLHLYVDGTEQTPDSTTSEMRPQDNLTLGASLYLAASHSFGGATNEMHELVCDDLRIYSRVLTEAEIQALYHEGGWMQ